MVANSTSGTIPCFLAATTLLAHAVCLTGCGEARADDGSEQALRTQIDHLATQVEALDDRVRAAEDTLALTSIMNCYGRGHDEIFRHQGSDQADALKILRECFNDDVKTEIFFFDVSKPAATLGTLADLAHFVEQNAVMQHYRSARNTPGDLRIEMTGPDSARVLTSTTAPHFIVPSADPAAPANVDIITAHFENEVVRGEDGVWRTKSFRLVVEELWRGNGSYPLSGG